jgi:hypothetical protein
MKALRLPASKVRYFAEAMVLQNFASNKGLRCDFRPCFLAVRNCGLAMRDVKHSTFLPMRLTRDLGRSL